MTKAIFSLRSGSVEGAYSSGKNADDLSAFASDIRGNPKK